MKLIPILAVTIALSFIPISPAGAASNPPQITPVSWIIETQHNIDVDGKKVTLMGEVVKRDGGSDWWFSDATGSVRLDTGDLELPIGKPLVVRGTIDQSRFGVGYLEVEVTHWEYAPARR